MNPTLRILSLGGGVQSFTLALMAGHGEVGPAPDCAVFVDLGSESEATYEAVRFLQGSNVLPFPVHVVRGRDLAAHTFRAAAREVSNVLPLSCPPEKGGARGRLQRGCTRDFKIRPIDRFVRDMIGVQKGRPVPAGVVVEKWIGFSVDEASRQLAPAHIQYFERVRYPLIEQWMSRQDCARWLREREYPVPPKSACIFCPYTDDERWRDMRDHRPDDFDRAVALDRAVRAGVKGSCRTLYLHPSLVPLEEADLSRGPLVERANEICDSGHCHV